MWTKIDYSNKSTLQEENKLVWLTGLYVKNQKWICIGCKGSWKWIQK